MDKATEKMVRAYCLKPNQITATELLDRLRDLWGDKFQELGASTQKLSPDLSALIDHTRLRKLTKP